MKLTLPLSAALALFGCSAVVGDVRSFTTHPEACPSGDPGALRDLTLHFTDFAPHVGRRFEAELVTADNGQLVARVIHNPIAASSIDLVIPHAVPPGDFELDFGADLDDALPLDHTWSRPVCDDGSLTFQHEGIFDPLTVPTPRGGGLTLTLSLPALPLFRNAALEVRVIADFGASRQTVGVYRRSPLTPTGAAGVLDTSEFVEIPGVLDGRTPHQIVWFFDVNRDGVALSADGDVICQRQATADASGIALGTIDMVAERASCDLQQLPAL